jgi:hypothetical protein
MLQGQTNEELNPRAARWDDDFSTIVSIVPVEIREFKPGLYPGQFNIDACDDPRVPVLYRVAGSKQMISVAGHREPIAMDTPSKTIARAIVTDYIGAHLFATGDASPGLAFVTGDRSREEILKDFPSLLPTLVRQQRLWFTALIKMADNDWNRYHNHKAISELSKIACRAIGLERDWLIDNLTPEMQFKCKACRQMLEVGQLVCHHCRAIQDVVAAEAAGIKFAA